MTSVTVSGSGPSSRTDPPSTTSTPCSTQACMIPDVSTPCSTALAIEPQRRMVLRARMWCSWPCSTPMPSSRFTPSEVPYRAPSMSWVARAHPQALAADHHPVVLEHVGHRHGAGVAVVDDDRAVHLRVLDLEPDAADPDLG